MYMNIYIYIYICMYLSLSLPLPPSLSLSLPQSSHPSKNLRNDLTPRTPPRNFGNPPRGGVWSELRDGQVAGLCPLCEPLTFSPSLSLSRMEDME